MGSRTPATTISSVLAGFRGVPRAGLSKLLMPPIVTPMSPPDTALAVVELLQRLIRVPSINPDLAGPGEEGGEARMADFLEDYLRPLGFAIERHEPIAGRPNVVGRLGPRQPKRTLLLESHLDTQGVRGMTVPPYGAEQRDGRIYGRGACDTKGPMAAALIALNRSRLERLAAAGVHVIYVGAVGEERGNVGAEQLVASGLAADEAVILEPTDLHIVHAHKGALWFEVELQGVAVHGSNPERGKNAVVAMARYLQELQRLTESRARALRHPVLGRPTANFGLIQGGTSINIVPDRCLLQVDRRTLPEEDNQAILEEARAMAESLQRAGDIVGYEVRCIKDGRPFATTTACPLVRRLSSACQGAGVKPVTEGAAWFSDAGPFSSTCREVAVFGPGSILQAHTADEFIEVSELVQGAEILGAFLDRLAAEAAGGFDA